MPSLAAPLASLFDPEDRVFWPFLATAALMAVGVHRHARARRGLRAPLVEFLLPVRVFAHPSSRLDLGIFLANTVLRAGLPTMAVAHAAVAASVSVLLVLTFGRVELAAHAALVPLGYTLALFLADDASRYLVHRAMHRVPLLWELHKVHHSAEVLTPLTVYRIHPLESLLLTVRGAVAGGVVTGVFFYLYGRGLSGWSVLGVNAFGVVFSALGANLRHSHVFLSFGPLIEQFWMSPAQHQIHHSLDPRHVDRNFGSFLAIWDRLGGTLHTTSAYQALRFGLPPEEQNHGRTLLSALVGPLRAMLSHRS